MQPLVSFAAWQEQKQFCKHSLLAAAIPLRSARYYRSPPPPPPPPPPSMQLSLPNFPTSLTCCLVAWSPTHPCEGTFLVTCSCLINRLADIGRRAQSCSFRAGRDFDHLGINNCVMVGLVLFGAAPNFCLHFFYRRFINLEKAIPVAWQNGSFSCVQDS